MLDFDKIDEEITKTINGLPKEFWEDFNENFKNFIPNDLASIKALKLSFVIDTNIVFQEVRSLMLNNSSFFLKVFDNPNIDVYAPSALKKEIYEKIKIKFPKEKKTKHLDIEESLKKVDLILSKIIIRDDISTSSLKEAEDKLKDRDPDDISFLGLYISLNSDAIFTQDRDISSQEDVNAWRLAEGGKLVSDIKKGTIFFAITTYSAQITFDIFKAIIAFIWNLVLKMSKLLIQAMTAVVEKSIEAILKIPLPILLLLGIGVLLAALNDNTRKIAGELWNKIQELAKVFYNEIKNLLSQFMDVIKDIYEDIKPLLEAFGEIYLYLMENTEIIVNRMNDLDFDTEVSTINN